MLDYRIFRPGILVVCLTVFGLPVSRVASAQSGKFYWQQEVKYKMEVDFDVTTNQYTGRQVIRYKNNSPDVLEKVFFHLYLNAFQQGSVMDINERNTRGADAAIVRKFSELTAEEAGYQHVRRLTQNGKPLSFETVGTILEVTLAQPLKPGKSAVFEMEYEAQIPIQIRRNGRDNEEGIRYSMAQWYPKICEYDHQGWHANPYVGQEFYGVWGDFDVSITIDSSYTVAASGILKNAAQIGHGYAPEPKKKDKKLTWRFIAQKVHDFVWAADPDYVHDVHVCADGVVLHAFYKPEEPWDENWRVLLPIMEEALKYINVHFGKYPYPVYSFIQAGDRGMEYPMATLITGRRPLGSLVGVSVHEIMHSWYQMVLGLNESLYHWMDEGFTSYATTRVMEHLKANKLIPGQVRPFPYEDIYRSYIFLANSGEEEPMGTHADQFGSYRSYAISAYNKGQLFLHQLEYVIGKPAFERGMLDFFYTWQFKHPTDNDFIRVMEKSSGLELDWYKEFMVYSTKVIDYHVDTLIGHSNGTSITLTRTGKIPMPIDVQITLTDNRIFNYTIPLDIMRGAKREEPLSGEPFQVLKDWDWVNPEYEFTVPFQIGDIRGVVIDPTMRLADIDRQHNSWPAPRS